MTRVTVDLEPADPEAMTYRAVAGQLQAMGRTPGEALDALSSQLSHEEGATLVIVRAMKPDRFFTAGQRRRLEELTRLRREAVSRNSRLSAQEQTELEELIDAEVQATTERAAALFHDLSA